VASEFVCAQISREELATAMSCLQSQLGEADLRHLLQQLESFDSKCAPPHDPHTATVLITYKRFYTIEVYDSNCSLEQAHVCGIKIFEIDRLLSKCTWTPSKFCSEL
jgi:hypothetical protein